MAQTATGADLGADSAFGALYTNDNKAELIIVVTAVICKLAQKYAQMQHPLFGRSGRRLTGLCA